MNNDAEYTSEYEDDFIIIITIDGTEYEEVECKVLEPCKPIRELIASIIDAFDLPKIDNGGNPIQYLLGYSEDNDEEPEILEFEDEEGRELAIVDCNIQPGDHLYLISVPVAGGGVCIQTPYDVSGECSFFTKLKRYFARKDQVFSSLFAPENIVPGDNMMIQLYLYKDGERNIVIREAIQSDRSAFEVGYVPLNFDVKRGESVDVTLNVDGISVPNNKKTVVWRGHYTKCCCTNFRLQRKS